MKEIEKQFAQYDTDKSQKLELNEFKACLYSLGHDYAALDLKKIMVKFGGNEVCGCCPALRCSALCCARVNE